MHVSNTEEMDRLRSKSQFSGIPHFEVSGCLVCVTASKKRQEGLNLSRQGAFIAEGGGH